MDIKSFNAKLRREFGNVPGDDTRPLFKLVFAGNEIETRVGTYSEWSGKLFVRTKHGAYQVPKYQHCRNCFVLERWFPGWTPELPETYNKGGYEGIYTFVDKHENPLPLRWDVAQIVCKTSLQRSGGVLLTGPVERKSLASFDNEDKEAFAREVAYFETVIDNNSLLSHGGGIVVPHNYERSK